MKLRINESSENPLFMNLVKNAIEKGITNSNIFIYSQNYIRMNADEMFKFALESTGHSEAKVKRRFELNNTADNYYKILYHYVYEGCVPEELKLKPIEIKETHSLENLSLKNLSKVNFSLIDGTHRCFLCKTLSVEVPTRIICNDYFVSNK